MYANFISDEGQAGVEYAYGERLGWLRALKAVYDPDNVFHLNNNIAPAPATAGQRGRRDGPRTPGVA